MRSLRLSVAALIVFGLAGVVTAEEKKDDIKAKLVGDWLIVKSFEGGPPVDGIVSFGKDGKFKVTHKQDGKDVTHEGTYTNDADSFSFTLKVGDQERKDKITIKKLTADELMTVNKDGKSVELKKKK